MRALFTRCLIICGIIWMLPAVFMAQNTNIPKEKRLRMHQEIPDNQYLPGQSGKKSAAPVYKNSGFTMVQVNVDSDGNNIIGDAANEPSIAIDPGNPNRMTVGWRQFDNVYSNFRQAGYGYTSDGGHSWTFPGVIDQGIFRSDPVLDCNSEGIFYYNSLTSFNSMYYCDVYKSSDGGASWDNGVDAQGGDKQWMVIDRSGSIGEGNIYSFWTSYYSMCYPGYFTRSTDGGYSFENCTVIPGDPYWGTLAVGNEGELYIVGSAQESGLVFLKSTTAKDPGVIPTWDIAELVYMDGYLNGWLAINPVGLMGQAYIDVDRSEGPGKDNIYVLASMTRISTNDSADVMFAKSTDGGLTWSEAVRINDDQSEYNYQWFGTMSVSPNGRIDVVWLDTRDASPGSYSSALYYSYSVDQGESWSQNEKLSESFDPHVGWPQQQKMGDYFDMISDENGANLAWANTLNGEQDVYYSYITPFITGIKDTDEAEEVCFLDIYPNPVRDKATVRYKIPSECHVTVSMTNLYGVEVKQLVNSTQPAGRYSVTVKADDLPAGYYFCRLNAGNQAVVKSLVKL